MTPEFVFLQLTRNMDNQFNLKMTDRTKQMKTDFKISEAAFLHFEIDEVNLSQ